MTIVLGMLRQGGLVMAADTEETATDMKRSVTKLPLYRNSKGATLVVGGAGPDCHIEAMTERLIDKFSDATLKNAKVVEARFHKLIAEYYKNHILSWPSHIEREENDFSLLLGISLPAGPKHALVRLLIMQRGVLRNAAPFRAIGTGASYAMSLMDEHFGIHSPILSALIAVYIAYRVKRDTPGCGKETQVWNFHGANTHSMMSPYIAEAESLFKKYEYENTRSFLTLMDSQSGGASLEFDSYLKEQMADLRSRFNKLSEKMVETGFERFML
jgi:ATP-dependent protease HslVU (ClpYQ) peptidase subunit